MSKNAPDLNEANQTKDPLIGKQFGDYRLTSLLATGGMARIYKGMDYKLQRQAAVKILIQDETANDPTLTKRFQREARAVAALEHDNIITIYQSGEQDTIYFIAMKFVKGKDLAQELKRLRRGSSKKMDVARALRIMEQVASALDYAHTQGVIHRDIKPSNILLDDNDKALLTDFGLVLRASAETTMGTAFGTPRYIAPEQAISSNKAVPQSDIYSLAVIMYEILTGETPFTGDSPMEIALSHISDPPPPPRSLDKSIPEQVEDELLKALNKDPEKRHRTAIQFIQAIKRGYGLGDPSMSQASLTGLTGSTSSGTTSMDMSSTAKVPAVKQDKAKKDKKAAVNPVTTKQKSGGRSRILVILVLLAVIAGVAVVALKGLNSGGGGAPITLIYNTDGFTMVNGGDYTLDVFKLQFIRGVDGGGDDFNGDRITRDIIPAGKCIRIIWQGKQVDTPPQCVNEVHSETGMITPALFFWRKEGENNSTTSTFAVVYDGREVARCNTIERGGDAECRFSWPVVPTVEATSGGS